MADRSTIGNRIRELREEKKLTQEQFAHEFHVSRETVSLWERGERDIKTDVTVKMADFFGVTCDYILRGIESDHVDIHRATGLSDKAISMLEAGDGIYFMDLLAKLDKISMSDLISTLLEDTGIFDILVYANSALLELMHSKVSESPTPKDPSLEEIDATTAATLKNAMSIAIDNGYTALSFGDAYRFYLDRCSASFQEIIKRYIEEQSDVLIEKEAADHAQKE